jgi:hypothetical protein
MLQPIARIRRVRHVLTAFVGLSAMTSAGASERLTVAPDNGIEAEVKDCLTLAVKAVNDEDVEAFVQCFPESQHSRRRRETGLMFVRHEMGMELIETQFLTKDEHRCEVAVRYRLLRTGRPSEIVSTVTLAKDEAGWRITKERLLSEIDKSYRGCGGDYIAVAEMDRNRGNARDGRDVLDQFNAGFQVVPGGCANGRCGQ